MLHSEASICKSLNWLAAPAPRNRIHCRLSSRPRPVHPARPKERFSRGDFHAVPALVSTLRSRSSPLFGVPYNTYYNGGTESRQFRAEPPFAARPPQTWTEWGAFPLPAHSTPGNVFHRLLRPGAPLTPLQRYSKGSVLASLRTTFTSGNASCRRQAISAAMGHSVP